MNKRTMTYNKMIKNNNNKKIQKINCYKKINNFKKKNKIKKKKIKIKIKLK